MAGLAGFEPATVRLEGGCSIQLSYSPTVSLVKLQGFSRRQYPKGAGSLRQSINPGFCMAGDLFLCGLNAKIMPPTQASSGLPLS